MKGVTLLEVMTVVSILAILAGLAFPVYFGVMARSKESEGWSFLTEIRSSELRYYTEHDEAFTLNPTKLDMDVTATPLFTYCLRQSALQNFTAVADPQTGCGGCHTLCLNHAGTRGQDAACPTLTCP